MFSISYGSINRENKIKEFLDSGDPTTAVILSAVHFEWMIKRTILKLGSSPTRYLREELESIYTLRDRGQNLGYKSIWRREIQNQGKSVALESVLVNLSAIQGKAMKLRGKIIHGNGTISKEKAEQAVDIFFAGTNKLREFALKHGQNIDERLKGRQKSR